MKKFKKRFTPTNFLSKNLRGFTLIELLIVIALLGALAVGLLAALDPFEQLKKGTDTGTRNIVSEVHGSTIRYYAIKNNMPWCPTGTDCPADPSGTNLATAPVTTAITNIIAAGELKSGFTELAGGNTTKVFVTGSQVGSTVTVCFKPTSKSFIADPNNKYTITGAATCTVPANCYWCVQ